MRRSFQLGWLSLMLCALCFSSLQAQTRRKPTATTPAPTSTAAPTYRYAHEFGYRAGYEDGFVRGKSDFNDARDRDVDASDAYRRADRTYEARMGNVHEYQHGYRIGFELAYDDGYFGRAYNAAVPPNLARTWQVVNQPAVATTPAPQAAPVSRPIESEPRPVSRPEPQNDTRTTSRTDSRNDGEIRPASRERIIVRDDVQMKIRLQTPISTKTNREGDQFTAVVLDPSEYADAIVTGHVAKLKSSGKMTGKTELVLAFDQIELRNGTRGRFAAQVERVYQTDSVKEVDEEGNVVSGDRTKDTAVRTGGGAALGAILGGVIGGGKGAAIGAVLGAGAGAGSVIYQGSKDLELGPGTEMLIRTASPARVRE